MTTGCMMALDLSAKYTSDSKPPSPTLSMSSDPDLSFDARPNSSFSDRDSDRLSESGFTGPYVKPVPGPMPSGTVNPHSPHIKSERLSPTGPGGNRPFKMYPMDPMTSVYSQMAASAASLSAGLYSPYGGAASPGSAAALPGMGLMDNMLSMSSPITQYLNQKRRRSEGRTNRSNGSDTQYSPGSMPVAAMSNLPASVQQYSPSLVDTQSSTDETPAKRQRTTSATYSQGDHSIEERRDESYWDRRRKNNEAAKRSRDSRRHKEEEIALRAAFLEQENLKLRAQVTILKNETTKLHYMLYNRM